jgi:hypothetical protein
MQYDDSLLKDAVKVIHRSNLFFEITETTWKNLSFNIGWHRFFLFEDSFVFALSAQEEGIPSIIIIDLKKSFLNSRGRHEYIKAEDVLASAPERLRSFIIFNIDLFQNQELSNG